MDIDAEKRRAPPAIGKTTRKLSLHELHRILAHANYDYIINLMKEGKLSGIELDPKQMERVECDACLRGKARHTAIAKSRINPQLS